MCGDDGDDGAGMTEALRLYSYWRSSAAYRVRIGLNLKGLRYDIAAVHLLRDGGEQHRPEYASTHPQKLVPVLRHAESLDLWQCAAGIARLADGAKTGKLGRDELSGSSITLTSLGALGGLVSTPVINHPEVAIVGVNRMVERPMLRNGQVVARQLMNLSSSFDHRVVDGMDAAQFIQAIRALLETPALLFVE